MLRERDEGGKLPPASHGPAVQSFPRPGVRAAPVSSNTAGGRLACDGSSGEEIGMKYKVALRSTEEGDAGLDPETFKKLV
jgi:hypothetical protein